MAIGTENYMAPELHFLESATQKSDIWALGAIFFELCNLKPAYKSYGHIVKDIRDEIDLSYS